MRPGSEGRPPARAPKEPLRPPAFVEPHSLNLHRAAGFRATDMIVCVCNALSDSECAAAAGRVDCRTVGCIYRQFGCRVRCGKCVPMMTEVFLKARAKALAAAEADTPAQPVAAGAAG